MTAEVFDLLELDLIRIEGRLYEGMGRLPLPTDDGDREGDVRSEAPRLFFANLTPYTPRLVFPVKVAMEVPRQAFTRT